ncbi:MAG: PEP-CTERM sorting domain-containing protein, partial [Methanobrevibacter sp.]|nr:PEP-CTERM sorting domain-containing protein [Candidatus Methanoflexus mossambicus]
LKVLKPGKFTFKYNAEGINAVVDVKGDIKVDVVAVKKNGTDHNDTKYNHGYSGMMKTSVPVPIVILALIAVLFSVIGFRRKKRD